MERKEKIKAIIKAMDGESLRTQIINGLVAMLKNQPDGEDFALDTIMMLDDEAIDATYEEIVAQWEAA